MHAYIHFGDAGLRIEVLILVMAQGAHHGFDSDFASLFVEHAIGRLAALAALAEIGKYKIGITVCEIKTLCRFAISLLYGKVDQVVRCDIPLILDRQAVGDGIHIFYLPGSPLLIDSFEYPGIIRIGEDETVVLIKFFTERAVAALTELLEQFDDDLHAFTRGDRTFERSAQHIHAKQCWLLIRRNFGKDRFVADDQSVIVDSHFCAPHPEWFGEHDRVSLARLWDIDVSAFDAAVSRMCFSREICDILSLVRRPG